MVNLNEPLYYRGQKILEVELENFSEDLKNIDLSEEYIGLDILEIALLDQQKQIKIKNFFGIQLSMELYFLKKRNLLKF